MTVKTAANNGASEPQMSEPVTLKEVKKTVVKIPIYQVLIGVLIAAVFYYAQGQDAAFDQCPGFSSICVDSGLAFR